MNGNITIKTQKDCNFIVDLIKEHYNIDIILTVKRLGESKQTIIAEINNTKINFEQSYLNFNFLTDKEYNCEYFELAKNKREYEEDERNQKISYYKKELIIHL